MSPACNDSRMYLFFLMLFFMGHGESGDISHETVVSSRWHRRGRRFSTRRERRVACCPSRTKTKISDKKKNLKAYEENTIPTKGVCGVCLSCNGIKKEVLFGLVEGDKQAILRTCSLG